jgi:hypothetical protein
MIVFSSCLIKALFRDMYGRKAFWTVIIELDRLAALGAMPSWTIAIQFTDFAWHRMPFFQEYRCFWFNLALFWYSRLIGSGPKSVLYTNITHGLPVFCQQVPPIKVNFLVAYHTLMVVHKHMNLVIQQGNHWRFSSQVNVSKWYRMSCKSSLIY